MAAPDRRGAGKDARQLPDRPARVRPGRRVRLAAQAGGDAAGRRPGPRDLGAERRHALRRAAVAAGAGQAAHQRAGPAAARRADQSPRSGRHRVAGEIPARLQRRGRAHQPRPLPARPPGHAHRLAHRSASSRAIPATTPRSSQQRELQELTPAAGVRGAAGGHREAEGVHPPIRRRPAQQGSQGPREAAQPPAHQRPGDRRPSTRRRRSTSRSTPTSGPATRCCRCASCPRRYDGKQLWQDIEVRRQARRADRHHRPQRLGQDHAARSAARPTTTPTPATIKWGANLNIGYYDQRLGRIRPRQHRDGRSARRPRASTTRRCATCWPPCSSAATTSTSPIGLLSGGERARVRLAQLLLDKPNVLVLDEPTNHLDIASREALEGALAGFDGTILCVSHDRYFLDRVAGRLLVLRPAGHDRFRRHLQRLDGQAGRAGGAEDDATGARRAGPRQRCERRTAEEPSRQPHRLQGIQGREGQRCGKKKDNPYARPFGRLTRQGAGAADHRHRNCHRRVPGKFRRRRSRTPPGPATPGGVQAAGGKAGRPGSGILCPGNLMCPPTANPAPSHPSMCPAQIRPD